MKIIVTVMKIDVPIVGKRLERREFHPGDGNPYGQIRTELTERHGSIRWSRKLLLGLKCAFRVEKSQSLDGKKITFLG
jgi:hypothetical protein